MSTYKFLCSDAVSDILERGRIESCERFGVLLPECRMPTLLDPSLTPTKRSEMLGYAVCDVCGRDGILMGGIVYDDGLDRLCAGCQRLHDKVKHEIKVMNVDGSGLS